MASNIKESNGEPNQDISYFDVKIIVVGEEKCGKSCFIEAFTKRLGNQSGEPYQTQYARVYQSVYEIASEPRGVKIFEILCGSDNAVDLTKHHCDANGFVFMYAIDDPSSFQAVTDKWMKTLVDNGCWTEQPSILVGNKKDLRGNEQVIQRLALNKQAPVTREQGESLIKGNLLKYFDCSSIDENDSGIHDAFHFIVDHGLQKWRKDYELFHHMNPHLMLIDPQGDV